MNLDWPFLKQLALFIYKNDMFERKLIDWHKKHCNELLTDLFIIKISS